MGKVFTKSGNLLFKLLLFTLLVASCEKEQNNIFIVSDIDGNVYHTVIIGTQKWIVENLKTTKYNDGAPIVLITDSTDLPSTPGYCWYNNDATTYKNTYGALYNWYTVNTGKLCPEGWHVPTTAEWSILADYLGGAGGKLKETGTTHWSAPNEGATNSSGFTALPGGWRGGAGVFGGVGFYGNWWSSSEYSPTQGEYAPNFGWYYLLCWNDSLFYNHAYYKLSGFSVRCVRD